jgi:hypothetical protein
MEAIVTDETGRTSGNGASLEAAMALLINNQAALVAQHTSFVSAMAKADQEFGEIRKLFDKIMAVLARHETLLEKLPEAIRDKIGFKN